MIMCVLLCYPVSIHMSQLLSTGHPISSFDIIFQLIKLLTTHEVNEKELFGFKVSTRALGKLTPQEIKDLRLVFDAFDVNNKGLVLLNSQQKYNRTSGNISVYNLSCLLVINADLFQKVSASSFLKNCSFTQIEFKFDFK